MSLTIDQLLTQLPRPNVEPLPAPPYAGDGTGARLGLCVASMADHMTDEGWQLFKGLEHGGYNLCGYGLDKDNTTGHFYSGVNVQGMLGSHLGPPGTIVIQDKREWEGLTADRNRDPAMRFTNVEVMCDLNDVFKLTVLKDSQNNPPYHRASAEEIGCHAWVVYYHPRIVAHLAPYVREKHLVRTYHSLDRDVVPAYSAARDGCVISGALGGAYPLRTRLVREVHQLPGTTVLRHPGYHRRGCETPAYIEQLSHYKVSICTASRYGYALRKIIEATAAGCVVVTNLPSDEVLPEIDANLVRIPDDVQIPHLAGTLKYLYAKYDPARQEHFARLAVEHYDYRALGRKLAEDIEEMRRNYDAEDTQH